MWAVAYIPGRSRPLGIGQVQFRAQGPIGAQDPTRPRHLPFHDPVGKGLNADVSAVARLDPRRVHFGNIHEDADHIGAGDGQQGFGGRGAGRLDEIPAVRRSARVTTPA